MTEKVLGFYERIAKNKLVLVCLKSESVSLEEHEKKIKYLEGKIAWIINEKKHLHKLINSYNKSDANKFFKTLDDVKKEITKDSVSNDWLQNEFGLLLARSVWELLPAYNWSNNIARDNYAKGVRETEE